MNKKFPLQIKSKITKIYQHYRKTYTKALFRNSNCSIFGHKTKEMDYISIT